MEYGEPDACAVTSLRVVRVDGEVCVAGWYAYVHCALIVGSVPSYHLCLLRACAHCGMECGPTLDVEVPMVEATSCKSSA